MNPNLTIETLKIASKEFCELESIYQNIQTLDNGSLKITDITGQIYHLEQKRLTEKQKKQLTTLI